MLTDPPKPSEGPGAAPWLSGPHIEFHLDQTFVGTVCLRLSMSIADAQRYRCVEDKGLLRLDVAGDLVDLAVAPLIAHRDRVIFEIQSWGPAALDVPLRGIWATLSCKPAPALPAIDRAAAFLGALDQLGRQQGQGHQSTPGGPA